VFGAPIDIQSAPLSQLTEKPKLSPAVALTGATVPSISDNCSYEICVAVPVPVPAPVALKTMPTLPSIAPISFHC